MTRVCVFFAKAAFIPGFVKFRAPCQDDIKRLEMISPVTILQSDIIFTFQG